MIHNIGPGKNAPEIVNALIEIPKGGNVKYQFDETNKIISVDRFMLTTFVYPEYYGFVPGTLSGDGDPIDILIATNHQLFPGIIISSKIIGGLITEDEDGEDPKIIAVPSNKINPECSLINEVDDLGPIFKSRIEHFFSKYKDLEKNKWVKIGAWLDKNQATQIVAESIERFKSKI